MSAGTIMIRILAVDDRAIRDEFPDARVIILTTYDSDIRSAMNGGARAYLLKTHLDKELPGTIRAVHAAK